MRLFFHPNPTLLARDLYYRTFQYQVFTMKLPVWKAFTSKGDSCIFTIVPVCVRPYLATFMFFLLHISWNLLFGRARTAFFERSGFISRSFLYKIFIIRIRILHHSSVCKILFVKLSADMGAIIDKTALPTSQYLIGKQHIHSCPSSSCVTVYIQMPRH